MLRYIQMSHAAPISKVALFVLAGMQTVSILLQVQNLGKPTRDLFQMNTRHRNDSLLGKDAGLCCAEAAVLLFGLIRHNTTIDSPPVNEALDENLLQPLIERFGKDHVHIYLHTYEVQTALMNTRNSEVNVQIPRPDVGVFHPENFIVDIQEEVDMVLQKLYEESLSVGDPYPQSDGASLRNILRAYWSLKQVWELSESAANELQRSLWMNNQDGCYAVHNSGKSGFDLYTIARLDTIMLDPLPVQELPLKADILSPSWGRYRGLNDRLAVATRSGAAVYTNRILVAREYIQKKKMLHAEKALLHTVKSANISYAFLDNQCGLIRVRAGARVSSFDKTKFCDAKSGAYANKFCEKIAQSMLTRC